eukprot:TRINITY_DN6849_c0_g1_i1.p1 TRINITY_DN6849_c0_g1~~TRINITY_DN6849_c0_g1_i1.p1  ORF type:complete len:466 (-),score=74.01 TRINITY_DN6849_c0_g1_i1:368-1765(-)
MLRSLVGSEMCIRDRLLNVCDNTNSWSYSSDPQKVFQCNVTSGSQCQNFETAVGTVTAMRLKPVVTTFSLNGVFFETCGGNTDNCTLRQCAKTCDRSQVRETTATAVRILDALVRVKYALTQILFPWLNCAKVFSKLADSGPIQACSALIAGLDKMRNGFMITGVALVFNVWVCFLGQKRFACPTAYWRRRYYGDEEDSTEEDREGPVEMDSVLQPHEDDLKMITSGVGTEGGATDDGRGGGGILNEGSSSALLLHPGSPHFPDGEGGAAGGAAVAVANQSDEEEEDEREGGGGGRHSRRASILVTSPSINPFATYTTPIPTPVQSPGLPRHGAASLSISNRQMDAYRYEGERHNDDDDHSSQEDNEEIGSGHHTPPENSYVRPRSSIMHSSNGGGDAGPLQLILPTDLQASMRSSRQGGGSVVNTPYHTPYHMDPVYASRSAFVNITDMNENSVSRRNNSNNEE